VAMLIFSTYIIGAENQSIKCIMLKKFPFAESITFCKKCDGPIHVNIEIIFNDFDSFATKKKLDNQCYDYF
jgi:hypothetical protein